MFGIDPTVMMFIALATLAVGGVSYAFLYDRLATERRSGERLERIKSEIVAAENGTGVKIKRTRTAPANGKKDVTERRKKLEESMKSADKRKDVQDLYIKKPPLDIQIMQAGMDIPLRKFYINSVLFGAGLAIVAVILGASLLMAPVLFIVGAFGLPRWWVKRKRNKRIAAFLAEFPNAIDVIVRAVKSGLPLNDGIKLIANESAEPVRTEFRRIIDAQSIGKSTPQACLEMQRTMPCAEAAFFGIVIQIQSQAGGNLSEALGNLSRVLRDRKKMKQKVQALAMEAKASAYIIGALPFIVAFLVYLSSPDYIMPLFTEPTGNIILAVAGTWMSIGIFVMKQMINFDI